MPPVYKRGLGCRLKQNYDPQMFKTALPGPSNPGNEISENNLEKISLAFKISMLMIL